MKGTGSMAAFRRFVALGDSTTEGLEDPYPDGRTYRGWADRLAARLAAIDPDVRYANLAIRGRKLAQIRAEQLAPALAMQPDLASVIGGINDVLLEAGPTLLDATFDADLVDALVMFVGDVPAAADQPGLALDHGLVAAALESDPQQVGEDVMRHAVLHPAWAFPGATPD